MTAPPYLQYIDFYAILLGMSEVRKFEQVRTAIANWGIVRSIFGGEQETTKQRTKAFEHFFNKHGEVEFYGNYQYLTNENKNAIIRPDNPSPLAAILLDGLALILSDRGRDAVYPVVLNGITAMGKTAHLSADADKALVRSEVQPKTQINHNLAAMSFDSMCRGENVPREPGQLDEWFIGHTQVTSAVGSNVPILLQPREVVMTEQLQAQL